MVKCKTTVNCVGGTERVTIHECCFQTNPRGLAFTVEGVEGCEVCSESKKIIIATYMLKLTPIKLLSELASSDGYL